LAFTLAGITSQVSLGVSLLLAVLLPATGVFFVNFAESAIIQNSREERQKRKNL
jgi:hypothetical protein